MSDGAMSPLGSIHAESRLLSLRPTLGNALSLEEIQALPPGMVVLMRKSRELAEMVAQVCPTQPDTLDARILMRGNAFSIAGKQFEVLAGHQICGGRPVGVYLPALPRLSCNLTQVPVIERRKTVTRRLRMPVWIGSAAAGAEKRYLGGAGPLVLLVDRARPMARRRGEGQRARGLAVVEIVSARMESLAAIDAEEVRREGLEMPPGVFIEFFCQRHRLERDRLPQVARLEWRYL